MQEIIRKEFIMAAVGLHSEHGLQAIEVTRER